MPLLICNQKGEQLMYYDEAIDTRTINYQAEVELTTKEPFDDNMQSDLKNKLSQIAFEHSPLEVDTVDGLTVINFSFSTNNDFDLAKVFPGYEVEVKKEQEWEA